MIGRRWILAWSVTAAVAPCGCASLHDGLRSPHSAAQRAVAKAAHSTPAGVFAQTLESQDTALAAAMTGLALLPGPQSHRRVAAEYRRLGVLDMAYDHFTAALSEDPNDPVSLEGLARIWRDWGRADLGLDEAQRAVRLAPDAATPANTLGTLLQALGQTRAARDEYQRALVLDPNADYALNNLCYAAVVLGEEDAVGLCTGALNRSPGSRMVQNNLGLAYATAGDWVRARDQFALAGAAAASYNLGILQMASGQFTDAATSFDAALESDPQFPMAAARARQARASALQRGEGGAR